MNSIHYFLINVPNIILIIHEKKTFFFFFWKSKCEKSYVQYLLGRKCISFLLKDLLNKMG